MSNEFRCENCQAFNPTRSGLGECVRVPPQGFVTQGLITWSNPVVDINDRCLSFVHKDGQIATEKAHTALKSESSSKVVPPPPNASKANTGGRKK